MEFKYIREKFYYTKILPRISSHVFHFRRIWRRCCTKPTSWCQWNFDTRFSHLIRQAAQKRYQKSSVQSSYFSPSQQSGTDQSPSQQKRQQTGACQTPSQQKRQQSGAYTSEGNTFSNQLRKENKGNIDGHVDCDTIMKRKTPSWQQKSQQRGAHTSEGKKFSNQLR